MPLFSNSMYFVEYNRIVKNLLINNGYAVKFKNKHTSKICNKHKDNGNKNVQAVIKNIVELQY